MQISVIGLLINIVENNEDNRDQLARCDSTTNTATTVSGGNNNGTIPFLVQLFLSRVHEDRYGQLFFFSQSESALTSVELDGYFVVILKCFNGRCALNAIVLFISDLIGT